MSTALLPSSAQRRALEAVRAERIVYFEKAGRYFTLGRDFPRAQQRVIERLVRDQLADVVYRGSSREGVLVLTDSGRDALEQDGDS